MFRIPGYEQGANITLLNTVYHKRRKDPETNKYLADSLDIIYKDLDSGEKKLYHIESPKYTYYVTKQPIPKNRLAIEKDKVVPVECKYSDILKDIAEHTDNLEYFYDNIRNGNYRENDNLLYIPSIFRADMNIEDYYRLEFNKMYKNDPYKLHKMYFDIEVDGKDMKGDFPESGECPINAITMIDENAKSVFTLLLDEPSNPLIKQFKEQPNVREELKQFVTNHVGGWKNAVRYGINEYNYNILFYDKEINLIADMFRYINISKVDFAIAWNIAFDIVYIIDRIRRLGYDPRGIVCHPDFKVKECFYKVDQRADTFEERNDYSHISSYTVFIDQLISFASRRKGQRKMYSYKLDYIGEHIAKVRKLDYSHITTNIMELPYKDYKTFVFYNVMDTIVQNCIETKVGDIDFIFNKSITTCTRYEKIHRQTVYLANNGIKDFEDFGYIMGNNINKNNPKISFPGAFVADPSLISDKPKKKINGRPINVTDNLDDFDYKALYPSIIDENNMSPMTMYGKIILNEQLDKHENRFNNEYFDRNVYFMEDLISNDAVTFGHRYMHLANYRQMYNDIEYYYTHIKNPGRCLHTRDKKTGMNIMCTLIIPHQKREMVYYVDPSEKPRHGRTMCTIVERRPSVDDIFVK